MHMCSKRLVNFVLCGVLVLCTSAMAEPLRLPTIFGDHMVLQRDLLVVIWGWAESDQRVTVPPALPKAVLPLMDWSDPANKHNAMIQGLIPYRIRGSIWYQGKSNHSEGMLYVKKTQALVRDWRQACEQPDLPYYYVQIAPYVYGKEDPEILATFWEAQEAIEKEIPHTGMVVIHDVGNLNHIHPRNKKPVGRRLALQALEKTYGKDLVSGGPQFDRMTQEGKSLRVWFKRTGTGLVTSDGKAPDWFEIAGEQGLFVPAQAHIDGKSVLLSHEGLKTPFAMRYAWSKMAEPNLRNKEGFPVSPFRAGEIPERALVDGLVTEAKVYSLVYSTDIGAAGTTQKTALLRAGSHPSLCGLSHGLCDSGRRRQGGLGDLFSVR